jgi:hypothetical protein
VIGMESQKLKFIGKNLLDLLSIIGKNQNLLRLIYYNTDNPYINQLLDKNNNLVTQDNITLDTLMDKNIILGDVDINLLNNNDIKCFLHPYKGTFPIDKATSKDIFVFDVCYPYICYVLKSISEIRPYSIGYEFFKNIDRQNVSGIGKVFLDTYIQTKIDTVNYGCVSFLFSISNANVSA